MNLQRSGESRRFPVVGIGVVVLAVTMLLAPTAGEAQMATGTVFVVNKEGAYLFTYQVVEGSAAKIGLWEDHSGKTISRAKPVVVPRGTRATLLKSEKVKYKPAETGGHEETLNVLFVRIESNAFKERDGRPISFQRLEGWMLAERLTKQ